MKSKYIQIVSIIIFPALMNSLYEILMQKGDDKNV